VLCLCLEAGPAAEIPGPPRPDDAWASTVTPRVLEGRTTTHPGRGVESRRLQLSHLNERVYIAFAASAIVLALRLHEEPAAEALATLTNGVVGTLLAMNDGFQYVGVASIANRHRGLDQPVPHHLQRS
jgi:hypothetical protein